MSKGGLAFLNKKSWHTGLPRNIEKTWLAEQADKLESEKIKQLQYERQQEYELQQLRQHTGVHKPDLHGISWMYKGTVDGGGGEGTHSTGVSNEQALLGNTKQDIKPVIKQSMSKMDSIIKGNNNSDTNTNDILHNRLEQMNRIRDDPLTQIMKSQLHHNQHNDDVAYHNYTNKNKSGNKQDTAPIETSDQVSRLQRLQHKILKERKKLEKQRKKHETNKKRKKHDIDIESSDDRSSKSSSHVIDSDSIPSLEPVPGNTLQPIVQQQKLSGLQLPTSANQSNGVPYGLQPNNAVKHNYTIPNKSTNNHNNHPHHPNIDTRNNNDSSSHRYHSDRHNGVNETDRLQQMTRDAQQYDQLKNQRLNEINNKCDDPRYDINREQTFAPRFVLDINRHRLNES